MQQLQSTQNINFLGSTQTGSAVRINPPIMMMGDGGGYTGERPPTDLDDEYNVQDELLFSDDYLPEEFQLPGILPTALAAPLSDVAVHPLDNIVVVCCVGEFQPLQV
jgi:hypothetical protein